MNDNQSKEGSLVDTTDCLEAIGVFRAWKNGMFVVMICCLVLLQILFWVVNLEFVAPPETTEPAAQDAPPQQQTRDITLNIAQDANAVLPATQIAPRDANELEEPAPKKRFSLPAITFKHIRPLIRFLDFVLILAALLYCLTMLFSLKISLLGRLGGINHISRAFFLSILFLVLILPWQILFGPVVKGVIFTPAELLKWINWYNGHDRRVLVAAVYYLRFTVYWLIAVLLLILSLLRSTRWIRATLRRLEVIQ